jgi:hypothetical protein
MKRRMQILFVLGMVCMASQAKAQKRAIRDSLLTVHVHQLGKYLSLSATQEQAFLLLERQGNTSRDSLNQLRLSPEQRKEWLTAELQRHDNQVKLILTPVQWELYNKMVQRRRDEFIRHAKDKKIKTDASIRNN